MRKGVSVEIGSYPLCIKLNVIRIINKGDNAGWTNLAANLIP